MKLNQGSYTNIYRAMVVDNNDPMEIGRVRVRVPFLHGVDTQPNYISDEYLPYALPCFPCAGHDSGVFLVPEVGTMVFVMFEDGDENRPIYLGQTPSKGALEAQYLGYPGSEIFQNSKHKIKLVDIDDTPKGSYLNGFIRRFTIFKSTKGSTIQVNDSDEKESLEFFDRLGQLFIMHSPVSKGDNDGGLTNRGLFSVLKNKFTGNIFKPAIVLIKSLNQSFLRFVSKKGSSTTDMVTVYEDEKAGLHIDVGSENRLLIFFKDGSKIEMKKDEISIKSNKITLDANTLNLRGSSIHSSSDIYVHSISPVNINNYVDTQDEMQIEDLYEEED